MAIWHARVIILALVGATGLVAALQMAHVRMGPFTSHGADLLCPALLYIATRRNQTLLRRVWRKRPSANQAASLVLFACYAWEFCQRYDLRGTPLFFTRGTFDLIDLVAYTIGVAMVYAPDRWTRSAVMEELLRPRLTVW